MAYELNMTNIQNYCQLLFQIPAQKLSRLSKNALKMGSNQKMSHVYWFLVCIPIFLFNMWAQIA
jgi:hypothetical protein